MILLNRSVFAVSGSSDLMTGLGLFHSPVDEPLNFHTVFVPLSSCVRDFGSTVLPRLLCRWRRVCSDAPKD